MSEFYGVPSEHVDAVWHLVERFISRALEYSDGEYWPEDIKALCASREMQLFVFGDGSGVKGAGVTQIIKYPRKTYLDMVLWASDAPFEEFGPHLAKIEEWAKALGAVPRLFGRRGWGKKLTGYAPKYTVFVREAP